VSEYSAFLFAAPSFARGAASVVDLGATLGRYNRSTDEDAADLRALWADAQAVMVDLNDAAEELLADVS
jgi:hypothetical protein